MVNQVTVIGILMIVNGSLATLLGTLIAIMGPVMFSLFSQQAAPMPQEAQQFMTVVSVFYVIYGSVIAIAGIMNIAGGISALRFRSRFHNCPHLLEIVDVKSGHAITVFSCVVQ